MEFKQKVLFERFKIELRRSERKEMLEIHRISPSDFMDQLSPCSMEELIEKITDFESLKAHSKELFVRILMEEQDEKISEIAQKTGLYSKILKLMTENRHSINEHSEVFVRMMIRFLFAIMQGERSQHLIERELTLLIVTIAQSSSDLDEIANSFLLLTKQVENNFFDPETDKKSIRALEEKAIDLIAKHENEESCFFSAAIFLASLCKNKLAQKSEENLELLLEIAESVCLTKNEELIASAFSIGWFVFKNTQQTELIDNFLDGELYKKAVEFASKPDFEAGIFALSLLCELFENDIFEDSFILTFILKDEQAFRKFLRSLKESFNKELQISTCAIVIMNKLLRCEQTFNFSFEVWMCIEELVAILEKSERHPLKKFVLFVFEEYFGHVPTKQGFDLLQVHPEIVLIFINMIDEQKEDLFTILSVLESILILGYEHLEEDFFNGFEVRNYLIQHQAEKVKLEEICDKLLGEGEESTKKMTTTILYYIKECCEEE